MCIQKKRDAQKLGVPHEKRSLLLVTAMTVLFLIAGVAVEGSGSAACGGSKCGTFEGVAGLMTDDAACCGSDESTCGGTALGVRSGGCGTVGKGDRREGAGNGGKGGFHEKCEVGKRLV
jgi:hypothetical protein